MRTMILAVAAISLLCAPTASAATVVGQWCDLAWPGGNEITIVRHDDARLEVSNRFAAGGTVAYPLRLHNGTYWAVGESYGAHYRVGENGELRLFDNEGFIRSARPGRCAR